MFLSVSKTSQPVISMARIRSLVLPVPIPTDQKAINGAIEAVDGKIAVSRQRKSSLQDLFRILLHELMTANTRVHGIDLSTTTNNTRSAL
jgi:restriction endonuclease S subunit